MTWMCYCILPLLFYKHKWENRRKKMLTLAIGRRYPADDEQEWGVSHQITYFSGLTHHLKPVPGARKPWQSLCVNEDTWVPTMLVPRFSFLLIPLSSLFRKRCQGFPARYTCWATFRYVLWGHLYELGIQFHSFINTCWVYKICSALSMSFKMRPFSLIQSSVHSVLQIFTQPTEPVKRFQGLR